MSSARWQGESGRKRVAGQRLWQNKGFGSSFKLASVLRQVWLTGWGYCGGSLVSSFI
jgi:hypothetical protein